MGRRAADPFEPVGVNADDQRLQIAEPALPGGVLGGPDPFNRPRTPDRLAHRVAAVDDHRRLPITAAGALGHGGRRAPPTPTPGARRAGRRRPRSRAGREPARVPRAAPPPAGAPRSPGAPAGWPGRTDPAWRADRRFPPC